MLRFASAAGWLMKPSLCSDPFYQSANAENAHDPFHVVGQDVSRHFGADVLECFHLEVRRSHPRLYRTEWMLDGNLQQRPRMIGRPPCRLRLNAAKAQPGQIKLIAKDIDCPNGLSSDK